MDKPEKYIRTNEVSYEICEEFLEDFGSQFNWKSDGTDSLLDIGCGPGDITQIYIEPLLPHNYKRIVGLDISESMLDYAVINYKKPKIEFIQCDIQSEISESKLEQLGKFDHAIAVKSLCHISDMDKAFKNIYNLLTPEGDFAFSYFIEGPAMHLIRKVSQNPKWKNYFDGGKHKRKHASMEECVEHLKLAGFKPIAYRTKEWEMEYPISVFRDFNTLNCVFDKLPKDLQEEYLEEVTETFRSDNKEKFPDLDKDKIMICLSEVAGYAKKI